MKHLVRWPWGIILVLALANFFALWQLGVKQDRIAALDTIPKNVTKNYASASKSSLARSSLQQQTEGRAISPATSLITQSQDTILLNQLISDQGHTLVFRYAQLNCRSCVDQQVKKIKAFAKEIGSEKLIIAATYQGSRDLLLFKRINNLRLPVYKLPKEGFGLPPGRANLPFLFILDNEFRAKLVFVPEKNWPELSDSYYQIIRNRFFNQSKASR